MIDVMEVFRNAILATNPGEKPERCIDFYFLLL